MEEKIELSKTLSSEYLTKGDATGWFDVLYKASTNDLNLIPWADLKPNINLVSWFENNRRLNIENQSALVIGCGLGDDSEFLSSLGYKVDAFDISETAIELCKKRFPNSEVKYFIDDFILPSDNLKKYNFIFEAYTIQALPIEIRVSCIKNLQLFAFKSGELLIVCRGRDDNEHVNGPPWGVSLKELEPIWNHFKLIKYEDYFEGEIRRFRINAIKI